MLHVFAVLAVLKQDDMTFLGTAVGRAAGRAAGLGRRAKRSQVRLERTEAGSLDSFGNDAFLSCRIESPSSRVARVTSTLHNLCPDHSSLIPAQNSHARMPHARCVVNLLGDTEDGGRLSCLFGDKVNEYEYSDRGQAFCCVWVRSYTADVFEVACRDVGRPFSSPGLEDFPGSGNRTGVCCPRGLSFMS